MLRSGGRAAATLTVLLATLSSGAATGQAHDDAAPRPLAASDLPHQSFFPEGQCTWLAYRRRPDIVDQGVEQGISQWNAFRWARNARRAGLPVGRKPRRGDVAVWPRGVAGADPEQGHVAYVRSVGRKGGIRVVELNWNGSGIAKRRRVSAADVAKLKFIHRP